MIGVQAARVIEQRLAMLLFTLTLLWSVTLYIAQIELQNSHFFSLPSGQLVHDFAFFWGGAKLFWLGKVGQVFDPAQFNTWLANWVAPGSMPQYSTWSYPPTMLLLLLPFGLLPLPIAFVLWIVGTFTLLTLVLHRVLVHRWVVLAVLLSPATLYSNHYGQNGALTAALLIAGIWMVDRRPVIAGACLGILIVKPQLGILLPFALAAGGYWRAFAYAALVSLGIVAATILLFGADAWARFVYMTMPAMTAQLRHDYGILPQHAMPTMWVTLQGWGADTRRAALGQSLSALIAIALVIRVWSRPETDRRWRNALTCALPLLATPFGYVYDAIPAMLAVALVAQTGFSGGFAWPERPVLAVLWVWPAVTVPWSFLFDLRPIGGFLLLAFALCLLCRIERPSATSAEEI
jgi:alpha-1,2-mannosyltransferase